MDIAIVGAGIAGISTAYELAQDGHAVTLYEQRSAPAEGASFANAGWLSPTLLQPWSAPGWALPLRQMGPQLLKVLSGNAPLVGANWRWLRQWKAAERRCTTQGLHSPRAQALADLSRLSAHLRAAIIRTHHLTPEAQQGHLLLLRTAQDTAAAKQLCQGLQQIGVELALLDAAAARAIEPSLSPDAPLAGALHAPTGETLNCRQWAQQLRDIAVQQGVQLHTHTHIRHVQRQGTHIQLTFGQPGQQRLHDALVICTGASAELLDAAGVRLPLAQLHGYTISAPLRDALHAPTAAALDWSEQVTISRMGQRIRISAGAELGGTDADQPHDQATLARMYHVLNTWYPGSAQLSSTHVQVWRGARGITPDGAPLLGASAQPGIWLNMAHGAHGAALAQGCARALADQIQGLPVPTALQALSPLRFHS